MENTVELSCHCGNIRLSAQGAPEFLVSCNCSLCRRYAALWGRYRADEVQVTGEDADTRRYRCGDEYLEFFACPRCHGVTHYRNTEKLDDAIISLNFRMAEPKSVDTIQVKRFDGADTWTFLD